jgi:hypothetical protein
VYDFDEFLGTVVARLVLQYVGKTEVAACGRIGRGDRVPSGAAAAGEIERRETAGDVVGLVVGRRSRGDQADVAGGGGDGRQHDGRLQRHERTVVDPVGDPWRVRQKDRVQFAALGDFCDADVMADIKTGAWVALGQAPCRGVDAGVQEVDVEVKLTGGHGCHALMGAGVGDTACRR